MSSFRTHAYLVGVAMSVALNFDPGDGHAQSQAVPSGTMDHIVQSDARLSALDHRLSDVVARAGQGSWSGRDLLPADQRVWRYTRRQCLRAPDVKACLAERYAMRIAEVSSAAGLPDALAPVRLRCDGDPPLGFTITYFDTDPGTLAAQRRDQTIFMVQQPTASGVRYAGQGATFAEHQGISWITWPGYSRPLRCVR